MRWPDPIREPGVADAGEIADLWTAAYVSEGEGGRTEPYSAEDLFETTSRGRVFVFEQGGAILGVVALLAPDAPGRAVARGGEAELCRLVVAAPARGQGIGRRLAIHCEARAREANWDAIALWSRRYQRAAHRLYESLGYRRLPERDTVDATGHARLVFRLELQRAASNSRSGRGRI